MITAEFVYWLVAAFFLAVAVIRLRDREDPRRLGSAAFWALLAFAFVHGTYVVAGRASAFVEGLAVLVVVGLVAAGFPGRGTLATTDEATREASAERYRNRLFVPALVIPLVAVVFATVLKQVDVGGGPLLEEGSETIIGLGVAAVVALGVGMAMFAVRDVTVPLREGDRLLGHIGWAAVLPQFLATLGLLFTTAGVGDAVGDITGAVLPKDLLLVSVVVYCLGMFVFTVIMGNAFAAFPVMTAAVGWPVLVQQYDGNPAAIFAIGMLAGFCGTLVTPMAANFNLVPAALLELKDTYGPIKAQIPTAGLLWVTNVAIMYVVAF